MKYTCLELRKFVSPEIITGIDARLLIGRYIENFGSKHPLIVTDKNVAKQFWYQEIIDSIKQTSQDFSVFCDITPNPKSREAMKGASFLIENKCDLIIAIGGGSPMDCAKCISIVSTNGGNIIEYEGVDAIDLPGPPLICIPSTAGTSADVSQFAIINDEEKLLKKAIISKKIVPDLALIDPIPLTTMDKNLTACTGMDAFVHAIEAYVSNAQSALTDMHAINAIKTIYKNIKKAVSDKDSSIEVMQNMLMGSLTAGIAFSNASLGAVHAMAHALGGLLDLPHGECNSILLKHVIDFNYSGAVERYNDIGKSIGLSMDGDMEKNKQILLDEIDKLRSTIGINEYIFVDKKCDEMIALLTENALNDPCMVTNPVELDESEVRDIYERVIKQK